MSMEPGLAKWQEDYTCSAVDDNWLQEKKEKIVDAIPRMHLIAME